MRAGWLAGYVIGMDAGAPVRSGFFPQNYTEVTMAERLDPASAAAASSLTCGARAWAVALG